jgi:glutamine amidotransferase
MIAIIDYGAGNLFSLKSSLGLIGADAVVTRDREVLRRADHLILPGVGAFGDAVEKLRETGMFDAVKEEAEAGKPLMGICLGMQLLFDRSFEYGEHEGLGLIRGEIRDITPHLPAGYDVPHMGWNSLHLIGKSPILRDIREGDYVYFVHSFAAFDCDAALRATADYGFPVTASVQNGNVVGCQFHPEKSGNTGMKILRAFADWNPKED